MRDTLTIGFLELRSIALLIKRTINYLGNYKALCVANKMYVFPLLVFAFKEIKDKKKKTYSLICDSCGQNTTVHSCLRHNLCISVISRFILHIYPYTCSTFSQCTYMLDLCRL